LVIPQPTGCAAIENTPSHDRKTILGNLWLPLKTHPACGPPAQLLPRYEATGVVKNAG
jgi:hypothetical protein